MHCIILLVILVVVDGASPRQSDTPPWLDSGVSSQRSGVSCTELNDRYTSCTSDYQQRLVQAMEAATDTCHVVEQALHQCGRLLEMCYHKDNVTKIKQHLLRDLIQVAGQEGNKCQVVINGRASSGQAVTRRMHGAWEICTEANLEMARQEMSNCSHNAVVAAFRDIEDIEDPSEISNVLCNTLAVIGTDCFNQIRRCYSSEDVTKTRIEQLKNVKKFLVKMAQGRIGHQGLDICQLIETESVERGVDKEAEINNGYSHNDIQDKDGIQVKQVANYKKYDSTSNEEKNLNDGTCTKSKVLNANKDMIDCSYGAANEVHTSLNKATNSDNIKKIICNALTFIDTNCMHFLNHCYTTKDISRIKQNQLKHITNYLLSTATTKVNKNIFKSCFSIHHELGQTSIQKNFYRRHQNNDKKMCSSEKLQQVNQVITNCSHNTALKAHSRIQNITKTSIISKILCDALTTIRLDCNTILDSCYFPEDSMKIKINQHEQMKKYLLQLVEGRVQSESLKDCEVKQTNFALQTQMYNKKQESHTANLDTDSHTTITLKDNKTKNKDVDAKKNEYDIKTEGNLHISEVEMCSELWVLQAHDDMHNCTSETISGTYRLLQNATHPLNASLVLCQALSNIDTYCVKFVEECYSSEYVSWLIEPAKTYLNDLVVQNIGSQSLTKCNSQKNDYIKMESKNIEDEESDTIESNNMNKLPYDNNSDQQYAVTHAVDYQDRFRQSYEQTEDDNGNFNQFNNVNERKEFIAGTDYNSQNGGGLIIEEQDIVENHNYNALDNIDDANYQNNFSETSKYCSESDMKMSDNHVDNCSKAIATDTLDQIQSTNDPVTLSFILCSAIVSIDTDCFMVAKNCFTPLYFSWLVKPMKTFLVEQVTRNHNIEHFNKCFEKSFLNITEYASTDNNDIIKQKKQYTSYKKNVYNSSQNTFVQEIEATTQVYNNTKILSETWNHENINLAIPTQQDIDARNYNVSHIDEDENIDFTHISEVYQGNKHDIDVELRTGQTKHDKIMKKQSTKNSNLHNGDIIIPTLDEGNKIKDNTCSVSKKGKGIKSMIECVSQVVTTVDFDLENITDTTNVLNILCNALTVVGTECISFLDKCFPLEDIQIRKNNQINIMKKILLNKTVVKVDKESLDNCNDHFIQVKDPQAEVQWLTHNEYLEVDTSNYGTRNEIRKPNTYIIWVPESLGVVKTVETVETILISEKPKQSETEQNSHHIPENVHIYGEFEEKRVNQTEVLINSFDYGTIEKVSDIGGKNYPKTKNVNTINNSKALTNAGTDSKNESKLSNNTISNNMKKDTDIKVTVTYGIVEHYAARSQALKSTGCIHRFSILLVILTIFVCFI